MTLIFVSVAFTMEEQARRQVVHNTADPAAEIVGVDANLDDFKFRTATSFNDVPVEVELNIGVTPATSQHTGICGIDFNGMCRSSGVYFYFIKKESFLAIKKITLLKSHKNPV